MNRWREWTNWWGNQVKKCWPKNFVKIWPKVSSEFFDFMVWTHFELQIVILSFLSNDCFTALEVLIWLGYVCAVALLVVLENQLWNGFRLHILFSLPSFPLIAVEYHYAVVSLLLLFLLHGGIFSVTVVLGAKLVPGKDTRVSKHIERSPGSLSFH